MRPTRKAFSISLGALILFGAGANSQAGWLYVIAAGFVGVVMAGMVLPSLSLRNLTAQRVAQPAAMVGEPTEVTMLLRNTSRSKKGPFSGQDAFLGSVTSFIVNRLPARATVPITYSIVPDRRGIYEGAPVTVWSGAPFGIARARRSIAAGGTLIVHPKWIPISSFPLLESASTPNEAIHERPKRGAGMDFYGLREYRSGDSLRRIHWRASARGGKLQVREYEEQIASRLTLIVDAGEKVGSEPITTFEDSISCAVSLVFYALDTGHPVQIYCDTREGNQRLFEPTRYQTLDWFAGLEADGRRGLARIAEDARGDIYRRSTSVLIFPSTRRNRREAVEAVSILQDLSSRVVAVMFSAKSYAEEHNPEALDADEEEGLALDLFDSRAIVYRVSKEQDLQECLREPSLV
ncbi:MAG TPA: DUF58 domain-containing protein [Actinomycetota bacterium]|nr:DUF58 domain-containing protein [Actinomycetota bacterium]